MSTTAQDNHSLPIVAQLDGGASVPLNLVTTSDEITPPALRVFARELVYDNHQGSRRVYASLGDERERGGELVRLFITCEDDPDLDDPESEGPVFCELSLALRVDMLDELIDALCALRGIGRVHGILRPRPVYVTARSEVGS